MQPVPTYQLTAGVSLFALFGGAPPPFLRFPPTFFLLGNVFFPRQPLQTATKASVSCVLFLFENAVVDTKTKYVFAIIGVFLLGFTNEVFR